MDDCCNNNECGDGRAPEACPRCGTRGKSVQIVTPKSLLTPQALRRLDPKASYRFCPTADCPAVYFDASLCFETSHLSVAVFQKDTAATVPVCYCFDYARGTVTNESRAEITKLVQDGKCACEFRNPQGSCCLSNVARLLASNAATKDA